MKNTLSNRPHFIRTILVGIMLAMFTSAAYPLVFKSQKTKSQGDTWCFYHKGTYYLYYLTLGKTEKQGYAGTGVSVATSKDGVHWEDKGQVIPKDEGATGLGSGSVWMASDFATSGKFIMNYSTWFEWNIQSQFIRFAESTDLIHWKKLGKECEFKSDPEWYTTISGSPNARWDCIYSIPRPGGGRYGYWTAEPKPATGGRVGFGETLDGIHWKALPPPRMEGVDAGELGAVEKIGNKYYMMYGTYTEIEGTKMTTLVANRPEGPFTPAKKNLYLLSGGQTYFSRFFPTPGGILVNHQSFCTQEEPERGYSVAYTAPLKQAIVNQEGTMWLAYWEGNEKLKGDVIKIKQEASPTKAGSWIDILSGSYVFPCGTVFEGDVKLPERENSILPGLFIETGKEEGTALLFGQGGVTQIGSIHNDGMNFKIEQKIDREKTFGNKIHFRMLLRHSMLELYVDNILIQCYSLPLKTTGRIGLIESSSFTHIKAWKMTLTDV